MPVFAVNCGRMFVSNPVASTDGVEASVMVWSAAGAELIAPTNRMTANTDRIPSIVFLLPANAASRNRNVVAIRRLTI
jgi:hypothetical protein